MTDVHAVVMVLMGVFGASVGVYTVTVGPNDTVTLLLACLMITVGGYTLGWLHAEQTRG